MSNRKIITLLEQYRLAPEDIISLAEFESRDGFQVITDEDLEGMLAFFNQYPEDFEDLLPILTDDNSNYLCVYHKGEYSGQVCYLSHDEIDLTPQFKNISHLIAVIKANPEAWDFTDIAPEFLDY